MSADESDDLLNSMMEITISEKVHLNNWLGDKKGD